MHASILMGLFWSAIMAKAALAADHCAGYLDPGFKPAADIQVSLESGFRYYVYHYPDGKVLLGGQATLYDGNSVVRFHADGSLDGSFQPINIRNISALRCLAVQSDGRILTGTSQGLTRWEANGSEDRGFKPSLEGLNSDIYQVAIQTDGKILVTGGFTTVNGIACPGLARLNADGSGDESFNLPAQDFPEYTQLLCVQGDGNILVAGVSYQTDPIRYSFVRLNRDGSLDSSFSPPLTELVTAAAWLTNGQVLVALGREPNSTAPSLLRLNADGSQDTNFQAELRAASRGGGAGALAVQPDGKLLVTGDFVTLDKQPCPALVRLNADGSIDTTFKTDIEVRPWLEDIESVTSIALQPDGAVLIAGDFANVNGFDRPVIARLLGDQSECQGRITFSTNTYWIQEAWNTNLVIEVLRQGNLTGNVQVDYTVVEGTAQRDIDYYVPDGPLLFASGEARQTIFIPIYDNKLMEPTRAFDLVLSNVTGGATFERPIRARVNILDDDSQGMPGNVIASFAPRFDTNAAIKALVQQMDGKILVSGTLSSFDQMAVTNVVRLNPDGTLDQDFRPRIELLEAEHSTVQVNTLALQPDGKILVGGLFNYVNGSERRGIARLNGDGTLDASFQALPGIGFWLGYPYSSVLSLAVQADGRILMVGVFQTVNQATNDNLARLNADGTVDASFQGSQNLGLRVGDSLNRVLIQPDGKILLSGFLMRTNGTIAGLARLNADGTRDTSFDPPLRGYATCMGLDPGGRILVAGYFFVDQAKEAQPLARLHQDGTVDETFHGALISQSMINALLVQADGKLVLAGNLLMSEQAAPRQVLRLNADGRVDDTFSTGGGIESLPGNSLLLSTMIWLQDGNIMAGGRFDLVNGLPRTSLAVLQGDYGNQPGAFTFSAPAYSLDENGGQATIGVRRINGTKGEVSVYYATRQDTANFNDFLSQFGTLTFADEEAGEKTFSVPIVDDLLGEPNETIRLILSDPTGGAVLGPIASAPLTIIENEVVLGFEPDQVRVLESAGQLRLTLARRGQASQPLSVQYYTTNGTAIAQSDYAAQSGSVEFPAAATGEVLSQEITIPILNDLLPEAMESFQVVLTQPTGAAILGSNRVATVVILDDDTAPQSSLFDITFDPGWGPDGVVHSIALQPDGKILIGGLFTRVNTNLCHRLARLQADGRVDPGFTSGLDNESKSEVVSSLKVLPDGRILIAGFFERYDGVYRNSLARLHPDGRLDVTFDSGQGISGGEDSEILVLALQADGKILVGGDFSRVNGQPRKCIARLLANGSLDASFDPGLGANSDEPEVYSIALQPDGKILVAGKFDGFDGQTRWNLARLHSDGKLDASFDPQTRGSTRLFAVASQRDGRVLAGGNFASGLCPTNLALLRLLADGQVDPEFQTDISFTNQVFPTIHDLALQTDGKILVGGDFTQVNGKPRSHFARLQRDGRLDTTFITGAGFQDTFYNEISALAVQPDGRILVGGNFTFYNSIPINNLARLHGYSQSPDSPIHFNLMSLRMEAGSYYKAELEMPALTRFILESSTNLLDWQPFHTNIMDAAASVFPMTDTNTAFQPYRFYRGRIEP